MTKYGPQLIDWTVDYDTSYQRRAREIRKGDYILIDKRPCKVLTFFTYELTPDYEMCAFAATDIFNGTELKYKAPASHQCVVPRVKINEYQVMGIHANGSLELQNAYGETKSEFKLPNDDAVRLIRYAFSKNTRLAVKLMSAMGEEKICGARFY